MRREIREQAEAIADLQRRITALEAKVGLE